MTTRIIRLVCAVIMRAWLGLTQSGEFWGLVTQALFQAQCSKVVTNPLARLIRNRC